MLGRIVLILFILIALLIGAAILIPMFLPVEVYRGQIQDAFRKSTGREIALDGEASLSLLPPLSIRVTDVKISNAPWGTAPHLAAMEEMSVGLEVIPFLTSRQVKVTRFVLTKPDINLEVNGAGEQNWVFEPQNGATANTTASNTETTPDGTSDANSINLDDVSLGDVRLVDGRVSYADAQAGQTYVAEAINVTVSLPSLDGPLGVDGTVTYNGQPITLDANVAAPRDLIDGRNTKVDLSVDSALVTLAFDGQAASQSTGALPVASTGSLNLDVPSVRELSAWAGSPMPDGDGFGPLKIAGTAQAEGDRIAFNGATLGFDAMNGNGDFALDLGGARPAFTGTLTMDKIDTRPYEGAPAEETAGGGTPAGGQQGGASEGWSTEPIDMSGLKAIDADVTVTVGAFTTSTLKMGRSLVETTLENGLLTVDLKELDLYEGGGALYLQVNAREPVAVIRNRTRFNLIQAQPLLQDLMGSGLLEGIGTMELDVTTRGRSQRDFMAGMNGTGTILFNDGALWGINLAEIVRQPAKALSDLTFNAARGDLANSGRKTDFAEMAATLVIQDGVMSTEDFRLLNPFVRILGMGLTNMVDQTVDFVIDPKAVATKEGQGGDTGIGGIGVPIKISGTWANLKFQPDLKGVGRQLLQDRLPGDAGKIIQDPTKLLKGDGEDGANPADVIQGLFGKKKKKEEDKDDDGGN